MTSQRTDEPWDNLNRERGKDVQIRYLVHFHQWPNKHVQTKDAAMGHFGLKGPHPIYPITKIMHFIIGH